MLNTGSEKGGMPMPFFLCTLINEVIFLHSSSVLMFVMHESSGFQNEVNPFTINQIYPDLR